MKSLVVQYTQVYTRGSGVAVSTANECDRRCGLESRLPCQSSLKGGGCAFSSRQEQVRSLQTRSAGQNVHAGNSLYGVSQAERTGHDRVRSVLQSDHYLQIPVRPLGSAGQGASRIAGNRDERVIPSSLVSEKSAYGMIFRAVQILKYFRYTRLDSTPLLAGFVVSLLV